MRFHVSSLCASCEIKFFTGQCSMGVHGPVPNEYLVTQQCLVSFWRQTTKFHVTFKSSLCRCPLMCPLFLSGAERQSVKVPKSQSLYTVHGVQCLVTLMTLLHSSQTPLDSFRLRQPIITKLEYDDGDQTTSGRRGPYDPILFSFSMTFA